MSQESAAVTQSEALDALARARDQLLSIPGVTSCGVGFRELDGKKTTELCIQCTVDRKLSPEQLNDEGITPLPETVSAGRNRPSIKVDVVQRSFTVHYQIDGLEETSGNCTGDATIAEAASDARRQRLDVIQPGCSIGNIKCTAGTLGAIVFDEKTGEQLLLSNWHVLHGPNGEIGDSICQPGTFDDPDTQSNEVGVLLRSHIGLAGDCAVASLVGRESQLDIIDLQIAPRRTASVELGDRVVKSGRTTGVTYGVVNRIGVTARIDYGGTVRDRTIECFEIRPNSAKPSADGEVSSGGDSGSLWLVDGEADGTDIAVGLHFAGETDPNPEAEHALASPIKRILTLLGATLNQPAHVEEPHDATLASLLDRVARIEQFIFEAGPSIDDSPTDIEKGHHDCDCDSQKTENDSEIELTDSNRNDVRSNIDAGGWDIVWGVTVNEPEYAKLTIAIAASAVSGSPSALVAYFKDYLWRSVDKFVAKAPGTSRDALMKLALKAIKDPQKTFKLGKIGVKGGIATYKRWENISTNVPDGTERFKCKLPFGGWTWCWRPKTKLISKKVPLPNHHQPFVGFRLL